MLSRRDATLEFAAILKSLSCRTGPVPKLFSGEQSHRIVDPAAGGHGVKNFINGVDFTRENPVDSRQSTISYIFLRSGGRDGFGMRRALDSDCSW
jgi:hypothetical protein